MLLYECEVTISLVAIVARLFMHGRHPGRYLRWKQFPNMAGAHTYDPAL
jgi:hypothetical protein